MVEFKSSIIRGTDSGNGNTHTVNVRETQYGSWTKLSLDMDSSLFSTRTSTTSPVNSQQGSTNQGNAQSSHPEGEGEGEMSVSACTQLLTQPPSEQQDVIIRKFTFFFSFWVVADGTTSGGIFIWNGTMNFCLLSNTCCFECGDKSVYTRT